ncbi:MAG TPA: BsuBI/PstI family type II restriction endonuclease [Methanomassiliicoccales archaeon]|nr:BsuBI/PstI family type II restriction endonuclease [Methanomassiliicoccales archaeon]
MNKIDEAKDALIQLGLPKQQINDRSALTLLVLLNLRESTPWSVASKNTVRVHDVIQYASTVFNRTYAENSRETFRRYTLHQFIQAGIVVNNLDDPDRATNSPDNNYTIADEALDLLRRYGTTSWSGALNEFHSVQEKLIERYDPRLRRVGIDVLLEEDVLFTLSPGSHNELQRDIIRDFRSRFALGFKVIYVGDTAKKMLHVNKSLMETIGIPITEHDKLPDIVLYNKEKQVIMLIEAVTSHGPVSPKRRLELETILSKIHMKRIYVSAFPSFTEYKRYATDIAWETEVWIASDPEHMIHKNGEKFFTLYE